MKMHTCSKCGESKPTSEFSADKRYKSGLSSRCRSCGNYANRDSYQNNAEYYRTKQSLDSKIKRLQVMLALGESCVCCGETRAEFLTIDHVNGGGNAERTQGLKSNALILAYLRGDYHDALQVMCFNCNCGRQLNNGVCPHELKAQTLKEVLVESQDTRGRLIAENKRGH